MQHNLLASLPTTVCLQTKRLGVRILLRSFKFYLIFIRPHVINFMLCYRTIFHEHENSKRTCQIGKC